MSKKKLNKADFLREWGLPYPSFQYHHLRYKAPPEKGVYWYYISLFVRQRDVGEYGTCISCDKPITVETSQAGHFCPASCCGRDLLFDELNINAECERCNAWDPAHLFGYEKNLDKRYGVGTAAKLKQRYFAYKYSSIASKDWNREQYMAKIRALSTYQQNMLTNAQRCAKIDTNER